MRKRFVFTSEITNEMVAEKLRAIEGVGLHRPDPESRKPEHFPHSSSAEMAQDPKKTPASAPVPLLSTPSSSRLEVPMADPRKRRPSTGSTTSSSSRPNSQDCESISSSEDLGSFKESSIKEKEKEREREREKEGGGRIRKSSSRDLRPSHQTHTPITIVEQPEEGSGGSPVMVFEPVKQRRRSLQPRKSIDDQDATMTIPLVLVNQVAGGSAEVTKKPGAPNRKALRKRSASEKGKMRRWQSDPDLGPTLESPQTRFVVPVLRKSHSATNLSEDGAVKEV